MHSEFEKPTHQEDEYFAREDIEKMRRLSDAQADLTESHCKRELKALHSMKCPSCGMDLQPLRRGNAEVKTCFHCHGMWIDPSSLDALIPQAHHPRDGWTVESILAIFKSHTAQAHH